MKDIDSKREILVKENVRNNEKEIVELKKILSILMTLIRESLNCGWKLKKRVKWPIVQLYTRKVIHKVKVWVKTEEKLSRVAYGQRSMKREGVLICEPEQGTMLREDDEEY